MFRYNNPNKKKKAIKVSFENPNLKLNHKL